MGLQTFYQCVEVLGHPAVRSAVGSGASRKNEHGNGPASSTSLNPSVRSGAHMSNSSYYYYYYYLFRSYIVAFLITS